MNGKDNRVSYDTTVERLAQFPLLSTVIDKKWLELQFRKSVDHYNLIGGWLTSSEIVWDSTYRKFTTSLDKAIEILANHTSKTVWNTLKRKIRSQSDRAESKGTLAEIALAAFLVQNNIAFNLETKLNLASNKDVDFSIQFTDLSPVHIEMQWVSESDNSSHAADVSSRYGQAASIDFPYEGRRIRDKVFAKTAKLTKKDITLVALDCTTSPELGGILGSTPISEAMTRLFKIQSDEILTQEDSAIREMVDGVIWFETDIYNAVFPEKRGYILNEYSSHHNHGSLLKWIELWSTQ